METITSSAGSSSTSSENVEVAVVQSPEVFGGPSIQSNGTTTDMPVNASNSASTNHATATAENAPEDKPNSSDSASTDRVWPTPEHIYQSLTNWHWTTIDGTRLPLILRNGEAFLSVHMVQLKLLSKFQSGIPHEILNKHTMVSHRMTLEEAWTLNSLNATLQRFDFGCHLYSENDEVVLVKDVNHFYLNVKEFNLTRLMAQYDAELDNMRPSVTFVAVVTALKRQVEADLLAVREELLQYTGNTIDTHTPSPRVVATVHSPMVHT